MNIVGAAFICLATVGAGSYRDTAGEGPPGDSFRSHYPNAFSELTDFYGKARGIVEIREENLYDRSKPVVETMVYSFASNRPGMARVISKDGVRSGQKSINQRVICYNGEYSFSLSRKGGGSYSIKSLSKDKKAIVRQLQNRMSLYLDAPFQIYQHRVLHLLEMPKFSVRSASPIVYEGVPALRVDFDCPMENNRQGGYEGTIVVSPQQKWALHEYEYKFKIGDGWRKGKVEYEGTLRGFPIPKRVTHTTLQRSDRRPVFRTTFDFKEIQFENPPKEDFTLTAFGLPEIGNVATQPGRHGSGYILIALSFVALAIAVLLRFAVYRLKSKEENAV